MVGGVVLLVPKVEGPSGHQVHNIKQKTEEKFEFVAERRGLYKFCFFNLGSIHETVDFDVRIGHLSSQEHLKDGM
jgi:protein ERP2